MDDINNFSGKHRKPYKKTEGNGVIEPKRHAKAQLGKEKFKFLELVGYDVYQLLPPLS